MLLTSSLVVGVVFLSAAQICFSVDIRLPPRITESSPREIIFRDDGDVELICKAEGTPAPTIEWWKNGHVYGSEANNIFTESGVHINQLSRFDEGAFQCVAINNYGRSLSNVTMLRRAVFGSYPSPDVKDHGTLNLGDYFMLPVDKIPVFPSPSFGWFTAEDVAASVAQLVKTNDRVQIDDEGNLHFAHLEMSDGNVNNLYKCNVHNAYLDRTAGGSYSRFRVSSAAVSKRKPVRAFISHSPVVALLGKSVSLRCFFQGYPTPKLQWSKTGSSTLPAGRYDIPPYNTELKLRNIQQSDEGEYRCRASNEMETVDEFIHVDVQAEPYFERPEHRPSNINVTEGDTVTFLCNATAEPVASVQWFRNGYSLDPSAMPSRMRILSGGQKLTISEVCKYCTADRADTHTDLMVIQCNASNVHGYVFVDAYVNVLMKTMLTERPEDRQVEYNDTSTELLCSATTDDSVSLSVSWYHVYPEGPDNLVRNGTGVTVYNGTDRSRLRFQAKSYDDWLRLVGKYKCKASNGYSEDVATVQLSVTSPPLAEQTTVVAPISEEVAGASMADLWWLWLLIVLLLLLLILLICCCICCCRRCKGDTYFVDKKERQDHKDPEKELADSSLKPYHRQDVDPLKGSRASLGDSVNSGSDEDDDLNEYGDIDAGKFTEDGSFIGDYADNQRRGHSRRGVDSSYA
jgi:receptor-type tyrosine-protein phosphatase zeta